MKEFKDYVLRYGFILGKRVTEKQRKKFLTVAAQEFSQSSYEVVTTASKLEGGKGVQKSFYNLYSGDFSAAEIIVASYYDTPFKTFSLSKQFAFENGYSQKNSCLNLLMGLGLVGATSLIYFFLLSPIINSYGFLSIPGLSTLLMMIAVFSCVINYRSGIPNKFNLVRNTSSLISIFIMAHKLPTELRRKVGFAFLDGGTTGSYGLTMLENYLTKDKKRVLIYLDSLGNPGQLQLFYPPAQMTREEKNKLTEYRSKNTETAPFINKLVNHQGTQLKWLFLTAGIVNQKGQVLIKQANTRKDNQLNEEQLLIQIDELTKIVTRLLP